MPTTLAFDVDGRQDPGGDGVLLLHSSVANRQMWQPQWAALAARHRTVRCDLAAYGDSPLPAQGWSDPADLLALLDRLELARVAVVGASYGGRVALELAATAPDRVSRLVLLCAGAPGVESTPDADAFEQREQELVAAGDLDGAVALNVRTWLGPRAAQQVRDDVAGWQLHTFRKQADAPDDLAPSRAAVDPALIDRPALVVSGAHDLQYFQRVADHLGAAMPQARRLHLPWAGHLPGLEDPAEVTDLVLAELAR